jgi:hypothetical protein
MMNKNDAEVHDVLDRLAVLRPDEAESAETAMLALQRVKHHIDTRPHTRSLRSYNMTSNRRILAVGLATILVLVSLMAFPSVRATAGDFLGLFRVQKFAPISVSPEQMALLEQLGDQGLQPGEFISTTEPGDPQQMASLQDAEGLTGYKLAGIRNRDLPVSVYVTGAGSGYFVVDLEGARAIVAASGADPSLLPDSLDGARVDVAVYPSVQQLYSDGLQLMQTSSPTVNYPEDVDPTVLGEALLQVLGVESEAAHQIAQSIDWTGTLLLPIPRDLATYREVTVNGVMGVALEPFNADEDPAIMWQKDGQIFMITGPMSTDELIRQANRLR